LKIAQTQPIALYTSAITLTETLIKPIKIGDYVLANAYRNLLMRTAYVTLVAITPRLAESAAHLRAQYGLRTPDALHAASAISSNCDAFLTNDLAFKKVKEISILILDELDLSLA
jgi:predicted nucleic acid-binding protein